MKILLLEGRGSHALALNVARCLSELPEIEIHLFSGNRRSSARLSRYIKSFTDYSSLEESGLLSKINGFAAKQTGAILLPLDVPSISLVEAHRGDLRGFRAITRIPSRACIDIFNDKWVTAVQLGSLGIDTPHTILYREGQPFTRELEQFSGPCLIKPLQGEYGQGIRKFENAQQLANFWRQAPGYAYRQWIVQSYIPGSDIDCSVLCREGKILAYTIQAALDNLKRDFKATMRLRFRKDETVLALVERLMSRLDWNGMAHVDLRYDERDERLHVLEINPRYWGSLMASQYAGVNFPKLALLDALGDEFPVPAFKEYEYYGNLHRIKTFLRYGWKCSGLSILFKDPLPETVRIYTKICKT